MYTPPKPLKLIKPPVPGQVIFSENKKNLFIERRMTTNYSEPDPLVCDETYSSSIEILKYLLTISYLIPGGILHLFILHTILVTRRGYFKGSSFFAIFALDSVSVRQ